MIYTIGAGAILSVYNKDFNFVTYSRLNGYFVDDLILLCYYEKHNIYLQAREEQATI